MGAFWDNWSQYFRSIVCPNRALYGKWWWEGEYYEWKQFNATTCYFHTGSCLFFELAMCLSHVILAKIFVLECHKIIVSPLILVFCICIFICSCICILYFVERCSCRIMVRGRPALHIAAIWASKRWKTANFQRSKPSSLQEMGREANASVISTFCFWQKCRF